MPELPEVTTIVSQLKGEIIGATINDVESIGGYRTQPEFDEFKRRSKGLKVVSVVRVAKTIVLELMKETPWDKESPSKDYVVIHLAMTGRLLLRAEGSKPDPWMRLIFRLKEEPFLERTVLEQRELRFCDARRFGYVWLLTGDELREHRGRYGPDPLNQDLTPLALLNRLKLKRTGVKRALLDQALIAGVGNIYANEALWLAGIHPEILSTQVTGTQAESLLESLRRVLAQSIENRGSTLDDKMHVDLYGREGEHQNHFRVYGKAGRPCSRCQGKIEFLEIGGRATFFCLSCQVKAVAEGRKTQAPESVQTQLF